MSEPAESARVPRTLDHDAPDALVLSKNRHDIGERLPPVPTQNIQAVGVVQGDDGQVVLTADRHSVGHFSRPQTVTHFEKPRRNRGNVSDHEEHGHRHVNLAHDLYKAGAHPAQEVDRHQHDAKPAVPSSLKQVGTGQSGLSRYEEPIGVSWSGSEGQSPPPARGRGYRLPGLGVEHENSDSLWVGGGGERGARVRIFHRIGRRSTGDRGSERSAALGLRTQRPRPR